MNNDYQNAKNQIDVLNQEILNISESSTIVDADLEKEKVALVKENEVLHQKQKELVDISSNVERLNGQKMLIVERGRYDSEDAKLHDHVLLLKEAELKNSNEIDIIKKDIESKQGESRDIDNKLKELSINIESIKKNYHVLEDESNVLVRKQVELNHRIGVLENSIENNSSLPFGIKSILDNPKLRGIHNVIGRLISFDDKYSTAIDVALGASSLFVVTDNEGSAKEAINYLKNNNLGRVTFFPLSIIKERHVDTDTYNQIKDHKAFVDIASNVTTYDSKYQNIILNQLRNTIIADNIDGANELARITQYRYRIVTLDGELLHVGGSITGGLGKKNSSIINEKYELLDNKRQLKDIEKQIQDLDIKRNE